MNMKMNLRRFEQYLTFPALAGLIALAVFTLTRLVLALEAGGGNAPLASWPRAFAVGLWFDLAVLAWLLIPYLLYEAVVPASWQAARWHRWMRFSKLWGVLFALLFGAAAEYLFWDEFHTRFNFIAVDYLVYTREVIGNILQSYNVPLILLVNGAIAAGIVWKLRGAIARGDAQPYTRRMRLAFVAVALIGPLLSWRLADIDQMAHPNAYIEELSGNGLYTFAAAFRRNELDYDKFYATMPQAEADAILKKLGVPRYAGAAAVEQHSLPSFLTRRPRNIVLISVESLSAKFLGIHGNPNGLTPNLDRMAGEGLMFERAFATGTRTVRGLEALSVGTPPVPGQALLRRPNNEHLLTVGGVLAHQGFSARFIYGGYGYFDNMNGYFAANDHTVVDRTDFPKESIPFENVWGVADESLYTNALRYLDQDAAAGKPFYALLMTTSNHRPFTYTDGRIDIPSPGGRKGAVKYTDWAIGQLVKDAATHPWFKDTLFVIVADHDASVAGKVELPVDKYQIPLILWAPGMVKPGRVTTVMSQIDIPPTLLDILGVDGTHYFFGHSFAAGEQEAPRAFVSTYQSLGYYKGDRLVVLKPGKRIESFKVDPNTFETTPADLDPVLRDEAIAYYQSAAHAFSAGQLRQPWSIKSAPVAKP